MSEKNHQSLSSFMKKKINDNKKNQENNTSKKAQIKSKEDNKNKKDGEEKDDIEEEMSEEEQLEEAKKASNNKAANFDNSRMIKKLIIETIVKYTIMIAVLVIFSLGIIKTGPAIVDFFNGLIFRTLMSGIK